jgi:predicted CXXCH cytochrome family protein
VRPRAVVAGALLVASVGVGLGTVHGQIQKSTAPAVGQGVTAPKPGAAFVGSQACRECHASTHSSWTNGRHSRMLQDANARSVIPAFDRTVTLHGRDYRLERDGDSFFVLETYLQPKPTRRRVDFTLGSRRVQHYLSRLEDGRIVVLPPSYDVEKKEWFHNLDIVDFEESGEVKVQVWNSNCFGCHVSGEQKGFDPNRGTYTTSWTDFGTSCERCHGPGGKHAAKYRGAKKQSTAPASVATSASDDHETAIVHPRRLDPETSTTLCMQCHSLRDITQEGFAGGLNYFDYFTPLLEYVQKRNHDPAYWPNGRPRRFSNEGLAFWQSQCYLKGGATCLSCHSDVHEPDIDKNEALSQKQDALCAGCHAGIARQPAKHSRHEAPSSGRTGVACVSCHMPNTVISLRHRMPDHTLSIPAPENTRRFSIPNACNECHRDKDAQWAEAKLLVWFPAGKRQKVVEDAAAFTLGAKRDAAAIEPLIRIAADASRPPLIRANAIGYLRGYADDRALKAILLASADPATPVRLSGFLSLTDQGRRPLVREALERGLIDPKRTIRMASALGLLNAGGGGDAPPHLVPALNAAFADHASRARFLNEMPAAQLDLGKLYFLAGRFRDAENSVRDALRLEPTIAGGPYFLGLATLGQGRVTEGTALLRKVHKNDPHRKDADAVLAKLPRP